MSSRPGSISRLLALGGDREGAKEWAESAARVSEKKKKMLEAMNQKELERAKATRFFIANEDDDDDDANNDNTTLSPNLIPSSTPKQQQQQPPQTNKSISWKGDVDDDSDEQSDEDQEKTLVPVGKHSRDVTKPQYYPQQQQQQPQQRVNIPDDDDDNNEGDDFPALCVYRQSKHLPQLKQIAIVMLRNYSCPLCRKTMSHPCKLTNCKHSFCKQCLEKATRKACPVCSELFSNEELRIDGGLYAVITLLSKISKGNTEDENEEEGEFHVGDTEELASIPILCHAARMLLIFEQGEHRPTDFRGRPWTRSDGIPKGGELLLEYVVFIYSEIEGAMNPLRTMQISEAAQDLLRAWKSKKMMEFEKAEASALTAYSSLRWTEQKIKAAKLAAVSAYVLVASSLREQSEEEANETEQCWSSDIFGNKKIELVQKKEENIEENLEEKEAENENVEEKEAENDNLEEKEAENENMEEKQENMEEKQGNMEEKQENMEENNDENNNDENESENLQKQENIQEHQQQPSLEEKQVDLKIFVDVTPEFAVESINDNETEDASSEYQSGDTGSFFPTTTTGNTESASQSGAASSEKEEEEEEPEAEAEQQQEAQQSAPVSIFAAALGKRLNCFDCEHLCAAKTRAFMHFDKILKLPEVVLSFCSVMHPDLFFRAGQPMIPGPNTARSEGIGAQRQRREQLAYWVRSVARGLYMLPPIEENYAMPLLGNTLNVLFGVCNMKPLRKIDAHKDSIWKMTSIGDELVSCSRDGILKSWNLLTWECTKTVRIGRNPTSNEKGPGLDVIERTAGTNQAEEVDADLMEDYYGPGAAELQPEIRCCTLFDAGIDFGEMLATGSTDRFIRIWKVPGLICVKKFVAHDSHVLAIHAAVRRRVLFTSGTDKTAKIWSTETWELLHVLRGHGLGVTSISVPRDCLTMFTSSQDGQIGKWILPENLSTMDTEMKTLISAHQASILDIRICGTQEELLASCAMDGTVRIWNCEDMTLFREYCPSTFPTTCLKAEGELLFCACEDAIVRVYNLRLDVVHQIIGCDDMVESITSLCLCGMGKAPRVHLAEQMVCGFGDGTMYVWRDATVPILEYPK